MIEFFIKSIVIKALMKCNLDNETFGRIMKEVKKEVEIFESCKEHTQREQEEQGENFSSEED